VSHSLLIVVPTLNSYPLLPRLITSLQEQSWPHWQVLFIDGPSKSEHRQWLHQCCALEPRCRWEEQSPSEPGIFGAMNQGFAASVDPDCPAEWLLFWGSDDWAASPTVLEEAVTTLELTVNRPDLLVCHGRYVNRATGTFGRFTKFQSAGLLTTSAYRRSLLLGSTPPHQATLFGISAVRRLNQYTPGFSLSADLDYFLQLSNQAGLIVHCLDLELVHISDDGISKKQTRQRLREVRLAYRRTFGSLWWLPFLLRYLKRMFSLLESR
jgi:glycosyltransferase involved in cell wall biosynthesis